MLKWTGIAIGGCLLLQPVGGETSAPTETSRMGAEAALRTLTRQDEPSALEAEALVRSAYDSLEFMVEKNGSSIEFDLHGFQRLRSRDFGSYLYSEITTLPQGPGLSLTRSTNTVARDFEDGSRTVDSEISYSPIWVEGTQRTALPDGRDLRGMSLREALEAEAKLDKTWQEVVFATHYQVVVQLGDRSRSYSAAFFWGREERGGWWLRPVDQIVERVGDALVDAVFPDSEWTRDLFSEGNDSELDLNSVESPAARSEASEKSSGRVCVPSQSSGFWGDLVQDGKDHVHSGFHYHQFWTRYECVCTEDCRIIGYVTPGQICKDHSYDINWYFHKMGGDSAVIDGNGFATNHPNGMKIGVGLGCAMKYSVTGLTGITVSVHAGPASFTFGESATPAWKGHRENFYDCQPCEICPEGGILSDDRTRCECPPGRTPKWENGALAACLTPCEVDIEKCNPPSSLGDIEETLIPQQEGPGHDEEEERTCALAREISICWRSSFDTDPPTHGEECRVTRTCLHTHGPGLGKASPYECPLPEEDGHLWPYCDETVVFTENFPEEFHCSPSESRCLAPGLSQTCLQNGLWGQVKPCNGGLCNEYVGLCQMGGPELPDLTITNLQVANAMSGEFQAIDIEFTLRNDGAGVWDIGLMVDGFLSRDYYLSEDDYPIGGTALLDVFGPGESETHAMKPTVPSEYLGTWVYVIVKADSGDAVVESSESNNIVLRSIWVPPSDTY